MSEYPYYSVNSGFSAIPQQNWEKSRQEILLQFGQKKKENQSQTN